MKFCRVCSSPTLSPLWLDQDGHQWHRCSTCGSDSSEVTYNPSMYDAKYLEAAIARDGMDGLVTEVRANCDWFVHHAGSGRSFLDVGCLDGAAMMAMADRGWSVHGFDVNPAAARLGCTTIYPHFAASLLPQHYDAILCREVIEHVDGWRQLLVEMTACLNRNGLLQIQTPRPWTEPHAIPYQRAHLQLIAPAVLAEQLRVLGYTIIEQREWDMGQAVLARRTDGVWASRCPL